MELKMMAHVLMGLLIALECFSLFMAGWCFLQHARVRVSCQALPADQLWALLHRWFKLGCKWLIQGFIAGGLALFIFIHYH